MVAVIACVGLALVCLTVANRRALSQSIGAPRRVARGVRAGASAARAQDRWRAERAPDAAGSTPLTMAELARLAAAATASASRDDFPYEAYGLERDADARARAAAWPDEARRLRRAQKKSLPPFFVYAHGAFNFSNLLGCFHKRHSCEPWACDEHPGMDHVAPEIWATQFLMHVRRRHALLASAVVPHSARARARACLAGPRAASRSRAGPSRHGSLRYCSTPRA